MQKIYTNRQAQFDGLNQFKQRVKRTVRETMLLEERKNVNIMNKGNVVFIQLLTDLFKS